MSEEQDPTKVFRTILRLLILNQVFIKCPGCGKALGMFEVYNENCSLCGEIEYNKMIVIKGLSEKGEVED